ncbi:MAG: hypothetical protein B6I31_05640 [Desulfobacteraceae bacterium 4572_19]|nr:MAG: hypothetical protein B6I31_05640 [Desulfobacteraceae bacterium 4572_19]
MTFPLFVPECHMEITKKIFSAKRFSVDIKNEESTLPKDKTSLYVERNRKYSIADITIESFGTDLFDLLSQKIHELCAEKTATIYVKVPASAPIPIDLEEKLSKLGLFFSGFMPETPDKWCLYYTYFNFQKFDFSKIKLFDEMAKTLLYHKI